MRDYEAYQQFVALCEQEAGGSSSGPTRRRTYIPREREDAEQRLMDDYFGDDEFLPINQEEYFRRSYKATDSPMAPLYTQARVLAPRAKSTSCILLSLMAMYLDSEAPLSSLVSLQLDSFLVGPDRYILDGEGAGLSQRTVSVNMFQKQSVQMAISTHFTYEW
ncbi:hypothetical protein Tco_0538212 [Tanacetum coccineum]